MEEAIKELKRAIQNRQAFILYAKDNPSDAAKQMAKECKKDIASFKKAIKKLEE